MPHPHRTSKQKPTGERLQRVLADAGIAARRACETLIEEGHVTVNGTVVRRLPVFVDPENDRICVDNRPIPKPERLVYIMLNKPERTLVTTADEPGMDRRTIIDLVDHPAAPRLFPVGRLDYDTTGLVLLTNDGDLANRLSHPSFAMVKTYHAKLKGEVTPELLGLIQRRAKDVAKKRSVEDRSDTRSRLGPGPRPGPRKRALSPLEAKVARAADGKTVLEVTLVESRHRPIKEILLSIGLPLRGLMRVAIGPLELKHLALGRWRELTREEIKLLRLAAAGKIKAPIPDEDRPRRPGAGAAGWNGPAGAGAGRNRTGRSGSQGGRGGSRGTGRKSSRAQSAAQPKRSGPRERPSA